MLNQISYSRILETIYALSALKAMVNNPALPGPLGRDDAEALEEYARACFEQLCWDLGHTPIDGCAVELDGDHRKALEEVVTDRVLTALTDVGPNLELYRELKARIRPIPRAGKRY